MDRMKTDWLSQMGPEKKVLAQYADDARRFTIIYAGRLYHVAMVR